MSQTQTQKTEMSVEVAKLLKKTLTQKINCGAIEIVKDYSFSIGCSEQWHKVQVFHGDSYTHMKGFRNVDQFPALKEIAKTVGGIEIVEEEYYLKVKNELLVKFLMFLEAKRIFFCFTFNLVVEILKGRRTHVAFACDDHPNLYIRNLLKRGGFSKLRKLASQMEEIEVDRNKQLLKIKDGDFQRFLNLLKKNNIDYEITINTRKF